MATATRTRRLARQRLDERLDAARGLGPRPPRGWVRAIREALGMSTYQLAERLGVSQPSVMHIEGAEARDTIRLETLRKAADALDCDLVYALVPRSPDGLQGAVHERALDLARGHIAPVAQTMRLEAQQLPIHQLEQHVEELAEELEANPRRLWAAQIGERD